MESKTPTIEIAGSGESLENCLSNTASVMFGLMAEVNAIHTLQILTFEFDEPNPEVALSLWLNLLLSKAKEHHLIFGDFRLKRTGDKWEATVSGEPWREGIQQGIDIIDARVATISLRKTDHIWEARCALKV